MDNIELQIRNTMKEIERLAGDAPQPCEGFEALIVRVWELSDQVNLLFDLTGGLDSTLMTGG